MQGCRFMIPLPHRKPGMSLLEVMIALGVFAIFGSSLFMMQQYLFDRMTRAHIRQVMQIRAHNELLIFEKNVMQQVLDVQVPIDQALQAQTKNLTHPRMTLTVSGQKNIGLTPFESTAQDKDALSEQLKNLYLMTAHAQDEQGKLQVKLYKFLYFDKA